MLKYNTVIWDMDGTVLNTLDDLHTAMNHVLSVNSYPRITKDESRRYVGNGIRNYVKRALPKDSSDEVIDKIFAEMNAYYKNHCEIKTAPYPGILEIMQSLNDLNVSQAIVSNKPDAAVKILTEKYFPGLITVSIGENEAEGIRKKPNPDEVIIALKELGKTKEDAVFIGDSEVDFKTAVNSGLPSVSVLWGFRTIEELKNAGAGLFINKPAEILDIVKGNK
ncbi:MAG: HAD family hydrolase [Lachnospiraceae bacterium]|nr:HAD family hydrolase [Lachnospiraceae bacterium]